MTSPRPATTASTAARLSRPAALALALALPAALLLTLPGAAPARAVENPITLSDDDAALSLAPLGSYSTGVADASAAEIVAHHPATQQLFVVNAQAGVVEVLDVSDPADPTFVDELDPTGEAADDGSTIADGAVANSVAVRDDGLVAVAIEAPDKTSPGWLAFFDATDAGRGVLGAVRVGSLPDMTAFTPDGSELVVANEGEPADDYSVDPEGSVAVVAVPVSVDAPGQDDVETAVFHAWEADGDRTLPQDVRVFGPEVNTENPVSANLEPEYATISGDSATAYVTLQEANAFAVVDLASAEVTEILPLGFADHAQEGNGIDPSDRDDAIDIGTWPVLGVYMPDTVASYESAGETYLVTANEGDAREWGDYVEPARVADLGEDDLPPLCEDAPAAGLTGDDQLGRLNVSTASGLSDDGTCYEDLYAFGSRSFSIWSTDGEQVFDSGAGFEEIVAEASPEFFNSNHTESGLEGRSDDKGPEPEGVTLGEVDGRTYAFIGFERVGGIAVYDVTDPTDAPFVTYINNRDFAFSLEDAEEGEEDAELAGAGDLGPEGLAFISAADSPTGEPLLAVGNEVSGTTTLFSVAVVDDEPTTPPTTDPATDPSTDPTTDPSTGPSSDPSASDPAGTESPTAPGETATGLEGTGSEAGTGPASSDAAGGDLAATGQSGAPALIGLTAVALLALTAGALLIRRAHAMRSQHRS